MSMSEEQINVEEGVRVIKKYPNRRIYDTHSSKYIKIEDIRTMIVEGTPFVVLDSKSGKDVTRSVLLQIIIEQESETNPLFTTENLKTFIRYFGQVPHQPFSEFMDQSLSFFKHQQEQLAGSFYDLMKNNPVNAFSEISKKNMEMWQKMAEEFYGANKKK
jgi:polyhydroxyalkanoate synthesis repressor PhaR